MKILNKKELKKRLDTLPKEEDLSVICFDCGRKRYNREPGCCTFYMAKCDICHQEKNCTEPRDFRRGNIILKSKPECDCKTFIGGSGKLCPECQAKLGELVK